MSTRPNQINADLIKLHSTFRKHNVKRVSESLFVCGCGLYFTAPYGPDKAPGDVAMGVAHDYLRKHPRGRHVEKVVKYVEYMMNASDDHLSMIGLSTICTPTPDTIRRNLIYIVQDEKLLVRPRVPEEKKKW